MDKQVDKDHYAFSRYAHLERFSSYYHQLREIHLVEPKNILEIGVGDAVVGNYLRANTDISYTSLDIAEDVKPDVIGSVLEMPFKSASFDVVCAFEVLEHIPFGSFEKAIAEMVRVAKKKVLVSVPHFGPPLKFLIKIPFFPELRLAWKFPYHPEHIWNGEHYWELGKRGFHLKAVREILQRYGRIEREYVPFVNQYHHFFVIGKR